MLGQMYEVPRGVRWSGQRCHFLKWAIFCWILNSWMVWRKTSSVWINHPDGSCYWTWEGMDSLTLHFVLLMACHSAWGRSIWIITWTNHSPIISLSSRRKKAVNSMVNLKRSQYSRRILSILALRINLTTQY